MKSNLDDLLIIAFCDPAGDKSKGKQALKKVRARSAIVVIGIDALRRVFVLFAWAEKCSPEKLVEKIEWVQKTYKPKRFGVEANAMQSLFAGLVRAKFRAQGLKSTLIPWNQSTKIDKDYRIVTAIQPVLGQGRLFVHESMVELIAELRGFPTHLTKDIIDALASAIAMAPARTMRSLQHDRDAALAKYLRASGMDSDRIRQRLAAKRSI